MLELGMSADDKENSGKADGGKHQIKYNWHHYFRLRPVAFAQFLLPQITGPESRDQQGRYSAQLLAGVRRIVNNNILASIAFVIVAAVVGYCLYVIGLISPAGITACAAIAAVYWARMQWRIYSKQCEIMRDQHNAMERQLELAKIASGQTDKIIERMRFEQRPWLAAQAPQQFVRNDANQTLELSVQLVNCGHSPAIGKRYFVSVITRKCGQDFDDVFRDAWQAERHGDEIFAVGPGASLTVRPANPVRYPDDVKQKVDGRIDDFFLIGIVEYTGADGGDYALEYCFKFDVRRGDFAAHRKYNRIHVPPEDRRK